MTITINDYSIASFLIEQAKRQKRLIVIHTDNAIYHYGTEITPQRLTELFREKANYSTNIKIGLK